MRVAALLFATLWPALAGAAPRCTTAAPADRAACRKVWTVLVYLAGDAEDLRAPFAADRAELRAAGGTTETIDVLVALDGPEPDGVAWLRVDAAGETVLRREDEGRPPAALLGDFLRWGVAAHPADHYLVVLSGHGLGWRPVDRRADADTRRFSVRGTWGGFGFDQSQDTVLDTPGLRGALDTVVDGPLAGHPLDLLVLDACLMQSVEVATELADAARYVGGSAQVQAYQGLPYDRLHRLLRAPPHAAPGCAFGDAPCAVARALPKMVGRSIEAGEGALEDEVRQRYTFAVVDTAALRLRLLPALARLADAVAEAVERTPTAGLGLAFALAKSRPVGAPSHDYLGGTRDLGAMLGVFEAEAGEAPGVLRAARLARLALDDAVSGFALGAARRGEGYAGTRGVAVWLPFDRADLARRLCFFEGSRLHRTLGVAAGQRRGRWRRMLEAVLPPDAGPGSDPLPGCRP